MAEDRPGIIFLDKDLAHQFTNMDLAVLRAQVCNNSVPPPGWAPPAEAVEVDSDGEKVENYSCEICDKTCKTKKAKLSHQRVAHNMRDLIATLTVTNQCMFCMGTLTSKKGAAAHVRSVVRGGACRAEMMREEACGHVQ